MGLDLLELSSSLLKNKKEWKDDPEMHARVLWAMHFNLD